MMTSGCLRADLIWSSVVGDVVVVVVVVAMIRIKYLERSALITMTLLLLMLFFGKVGQGWM